MAEAAPLFSFGIVTDLQYADKEPVEVEDRLRDYRNALIKLDRAIDGFNAAAPLEFVIHLGDIVDGNDTQDKNEADFSLVLRHLQRISCTGAVHHVIGNHCLATPRQRLYEGLGMSGPYYSFVAHGWRFVVLDSCDVSVSWPAETSNHQEAQRWLREHADAPNAMEWNGGISAKQLGWLRQELAAADLAGESVVVFNHIPLVPAAASEQHIVYNARELLDVLESSPRVHWYFCGHYHRGGYARVGPVHHVTCEALLEARLDSTAYAIVDVHPDRLVVNGVGSFTSRDLRA